MLAKRVLSLVLHDDALTRGLGDPEARVLVEWLVERAEQFAAAHPDEEAVVRRLRALCRRARAIACFVRLWGTRRGRGAAAQLAATERFRWPLPSGPVEPCDLMADILRWEGEADSANGGGPAPSRTLPPRAA
jgi:hypothetical protein